jgi:hypothetical protein
MSRSAIIIPQLKELLGRGLDQAIKRIEELLLPSATGYNMFVQVKGRYSNYLSNVALGMVSQKDLDQQLLRPHHVIYLHLGLIFMGLKMQ